MDHFDKVYITAAKTLYNEELKRLRNRIKASKTIPWNRKLELQKQSIIEEEQRELKRDKAKDPWTKLMDSKVIKRR
jgi:hypothetical protein